MKTFDACRSEIPPGRRSDDLADTSIAQIKVPDFALSQVGFGLRVLFLAHQYAIDVQASPWQFAIRVDELRAHGLTDNDLRWLVRKGMIEPRLETTSPGDEERSFRQMTGVRLAKRTAFALTPAGLLMHGSVPQETTSATGLRRFDALRPPAPGASIIPHWDADRQELRVNGMVVKQFKVPAPNQEMVLAAFQEENWPPRIDDPLPPQAEQDPKRRLHDTIVSLNRTQKHRLVKFLGDDSGEGVRWATVVENAG